jgi:glycosyltransferase involved in cell wall biosynthesis
LRILVIVHQFLPRDSAGTEVYTHKLAKALQARGHELAVYYTTNDPVRPQYSFRRATYDGLTCYEVVHKHEFPDFRHVYKDVRMEAHLETVLDDVRPDVVHIQHLHLHSIGYLGILAARHLPIVYTLAEYLLICLRSWLVKPDFTLCEGPSPAQCAHCATIVSPPVRPARVRSGPRPRYSLRRFLGKLEHRLRPARYRMAVEQRWREIHAELAHVDLFIAPSRFLRERFVTSGMLEPERVAYSDYGFDRAPFAGVKRSAGRQRTDGKLRVGFIGSIAEQKGVHLLIEAFQGLAEEAAECWIYGDPGAFPSYTASLKPRPGQVRFLGRYDNTRIAAVLAEIDVLAVPSRWFENSPLSIHEAFLARVPVLTGDRGGMAELVPHGVCGLQFKIGDADDLRRQILRLCREPGLLEELRRGIPDVKDIATDAEELEARFQALLEGRKANALAPRRLME